jgi:hypothetical protein
MIPGAVFAGLMTTDGVVPHFLDAQLGLSQAWILLVAGVALILCLRRFPAGIAGSWKGARLRRPSGERPSPPDRDVEDDRDRDGVQARMRDPLLRPRPGEAEGVGEG